eukprot:CAMPEP_0180489312 /NCGR_PEP_ID=MMETSP1036_2-20121128/38522_1 /TAXON_ID=632150 /ORGANISM="Azadinium spinosum, Strain 3D9" /LENGTH=59 /DNA_ID=CAMNT_0022497445 /DNA_START=106 /DNA_END=285 /DNA_ORIENTATION=+
MALDGQRACCHLRRGLRLVNWMIRVEVHGFRVEGNMVERGWREVDVADAPLRTAAATHV